MKKSAKRKYHVNFIIVFDVSLLQNIPLRIYFRVVEIL